MKDYAFLQTAASAKFVPYGSGSPFKDDLQMSKLDTKAADKAFRTCKRTILDPYMKSHGFYKYKTAGYVRLNPIGLVEFISTLRMPHGCKTCTMDIALIPLYVPMDFLIIGFGDRIGWFMGTGDFWWDFQTPAIAAESFENMVDAVDTFVLPWFQRYENENTFLQDMKEGRYSPGYSVEDYAFYTYLRNHDLQGAQQFLNTAHTLPLYDRVIRFQRPSVFDQTIDRLQTILTSLDDVKAYIDSCIRNNIATLKYPDAFDITLR